jgi:phosphoribosylglycinamide formyltransferase-1
VNKAKGYVVSVLIVDNRHAFAIERAKRLNIPYQVVDAGSYSSKQAYEKEIVKILEPYKVSWIALAGYMRICGHTLLNRYPDRIINIHPALLPSFPGKDASKVAAASIESAASRSIMSTLESKPQIIAQVPNSIPDLREDTIHNGIHMIEHELNPTPFMN